MVINSSILVACLLMLRLSFCATEDVCTIDSTTLKLPLQVAFVVDHTITGDNTGVYALFQNETIRHVMSELSQRSSRTEFALTSFGDWPDDNETYSLNDM